jgi:ribosomal protein S18 acetylase RimI-like enzyme
MHANLARPDANVRLRPGKPADLAALLALESRVFLTDRISGRSYRRFLSSPDADLLVAEQGSDLAGYALVLYRRGSAVARLYSLAVAPELAGRGIGSALLAAAEAAAIRRQCSSLRLEVHPDNPAALSLYRRAGYRQFGRHEAYYEDGSDALRFEKPIHTAIFQGRALPPYFHQTTEFTCGSACMIMALAWADPTLRPDPALEFNLWREATTIILGGGPGGCGPFGLAVTLRRHGLSPEIFASHSDPYFLDTVSDKDKHRVMRVVHAEFRRAADELSIPTNLTPVGESDFMQALDSGAVAIVLVAGDNLRRGTPHWVFVFGHEGRYVLVHDPAAKRDGHGNAVSAETYAVPWTVFERLTRCGRDKMQAAIVIRKGALP